MSTTGLACIVGSMKLATAVRATTTAYLISYLPIKLQKIEPETRIQGRGLTH
jgi:hypothetical protein